MNWYKKSQNINTETKDFPYGYHGTDYEKINSIKVKGLDSESFFAGNEDDISPYADGIWLRFPFPSKYEQRVGIGDYFTTKEIIPNNLIEIKTDVWGDYIPLNQYDENIPKDIPDKYKNYLTQEPQPAYHDVAQNIIENYSMNWYKQAKNEAPPISMISYNSYGEMGISFNGGTKYTYPGVSPFYKDKIEFLLLKKNYKAVHKLLNNFSKVNKKEQSPPEPVHEQTSEPLQKPQQGMFPFMEGSWFGRILYAAIWDTDSDGSFEDNLKAMAELEYKLYAIKTWPFSGMPQRQANIVQKLEEELWVVLEELKTPLENTFRSWLSAHALTNPSEWAAGRMDPYGDGAYDYIQSIGEESAITGVVDEYLRYKHNNQGRYPESIDQGFSEMLLAALQQPENFPSLQELSNLYAQDQKEMYNNELYSEGFETFGENYVGQPFESEEAAEQWIEEQVSNFDLSEHIYDTGMENFIASFQYSEASLEQFLQELNQHIVFPMWMNYWRGMGIEGTRELAQEAYEMLENASSLQETIVAINHAIDVNHQNGQMIEHMDTYSGLDNIDPSQIVEMMSNISDGVYIPKWNEELKQIGISVSEMTTSSVV